MASTQAWIQTTDYMAPSLYPPEQQGGGGGERSECVIPSLWAVWLGWGALIKVLASAIREDFQERNVAPG